MGCFRLFIPAEFDPIIKKTADVPHINLSDAPHSVTMSKITKLSKTEEMDSNVDIIFDPAAVLPEEFDLESIYLIYIRMDRIMADGSLLVSPTLTEVKKAQNLLEIWAESAPSYYPNREYETVLVRIWSDEAEIQFKMQLTRQHYSMGMYIRIAARIHDLRWQKAFEEQDVNKLIRLEKKSQLLRELMRDLQITCK